MNRRNLRILVLVVTVFGLGHHLDHVIRGNHVGWPLTPHVNPFTYSLLFYPAIGLGLRLRLGPGFWAVLAGAGTAFVGLLHFGPWALEPPADVVGPYRSVVAGYAALGWLAVFVAVLAGTALFAGGLWRRERRGGSGHGDVGRRS